MSAPKSQLSDEQMLDALLRTNAGETDDELMRLRSGIAGYAQWAHKAADRPEGFWNWQRAQIMTRLPERRNYRRALIWMAATAAMVVSFWLAQPKPQSEVSAYDPDEELLMDVHSALHRTVPTAFDPGTLIVEEIDQYEESGETGPQERNP